MLQLAKISRLTSYLINCSHQGRVTHCQSFAYESIEYCSVDSAKYIIVLNPSNSHFNARGMLFNLCIMDLEADSLCWMGWLEGDVCISVSVVVFNIHCICFCIPAL